MAKAETEKVSEKKTDTRSLRLSADDVAKIRALRAQQDDEGRPKFSHGKIAEKFGTSAGIVSAIVRNLSYVDENYKPVNDGPNSKRAAYGKKAG